VYCEGLGLRVLGHIEDHEGFDGARLGKSEMHHNCARFVLKPTSFQPTQAYSSQSSSFWTFPGLVDTAN
jgi:hypothetical protein